MNIKIRDEFDVLTGSWWASDEIESICPVDVEIIMKFLKFPWQGWRELPLTDCGWERRRFGSRLTQSTGLRRWPPICTGVTTWFSSLQGNNFTNHYRSFR